MHEGAKDEYEVTAKVTSGPEELESAKLGGIVVLKDEEGTVVGADFWTPENLPDTVAPGTTFTMKISFVVVTAKPASAEIFATLEP